MSIVVVHVHLQQYTYISCVSMLRVSVYMYMYVCIPVHIIPTSAITDSKPLILSTVPYSLAEALTSSSKPATNAAS